MPQTQGSMLAAAWVSTPTQGLPLRWRLGIPHGEHHSYDGGRHWRPSGGGNDNGAERIWRWWPSIVADLTTATSIYGGYSGGTWWAPLGADARPPPDLALLLVDLGRRWWQDFFIILF